MKSFKRKKILLCLLSAAASAAVMAGAAYLDVEGSARMFRRTEAELTESIRTEDDIVTALLKYAGKSSNRSFFLYDRAVVADHGRTMTEIRSQIRFLESENARRWEIYAAAYLVHISILSLLVIFFLICSRPEEKDLSDFPEETENNARYH